MEAEEKTHLYGGSLGVLSSARGEMITLLSLWKDADSFLPPILRLLMVSTTGRRDKRVFRWEEGDAEVKIKTKQETSNEKVEEKKSQESGMGKGTTSEYYIGQSRHCLLFSWSMSCLLRELLHHSQQLDLLCSYCMFCLASPFTFPSFFLCQEDDGAADLKSGKPFLLDLLWSAPGAQLVSRQCGGCSWQCWISRERQAGGFEWVHSEDPSLQQMLLQNLLRLNHGSVAASPLHFSEVLEETVSGWLLILSSCLQYLYEWDKVAKRFDVVCCPSPELLLWVFWW